VKAIVLLILKLPATWWWAVSLAPILCPFGRWLGRPQSRFGHFGERIFLGSPGSEAWKVQLV